MYRELGDTEFFDAYSVGDAYNLMLILRADFISNECHEVLLAFRSINLRTQREIQQ